LRTYDVFVGLGANLGDRAAALNAASAALGRLEGTRVLAGSPVYDTTPVGVTDQPSFLNAVMWLETVLEPAALVRETQRIESALGRRHSDRWGPREIDIDVLLYDGLVYADATVTVPHPEMEKRRFVLVPLREIAPDLVHPVSGRTIEELAAACSAQGGIKRTSYCLRW
jgi:2-amino-4-hydroxy-6-hydroxymethyldihydropteridine diphosphokinase